MTYMPNQYNFGQNQFPEDITAAYGMILHYKSDTKSKKKGNPSPKSDDDDDGDEVDASFVNNGLKSNKSNIYTESNSSPSVDNNEDNVPDDDDSDSDSTSYRLKDAKHDEAVNFHLDHTDDDSHNSDSGLDGF